MQTAWAQMQLVTCGPPGLADGWLQIVYKIHRRAKSTPVGMWSWCFSPWLWEVSILARRGPPRGAFESVFRFPSFTFDLAIHWLTLIAGYLCYGCTDPCPLLGIPCRRRRWPRTCCLQFRLRGCTRQEQQGSWRHRAAGRCFRVSLTPFREGAGRVEYARRSRRGCCPRGRQRGRQKHYIAAGMTSTHSTKETGQTFDALLVTGDAFLWSSVGYCAFRWARSSISGLELA